MTTVRARLLMISVRNNDAKMNPATKTDGDMEGKAESPSATATNTPASLN